MSQEPQNPSVQTPPPKRQYERSGCYPEHGRPFRIWALVGALTLVVILLAATAWVLNLILL